MKSIRKIISILVVAVLLQASCFILVIHAANVDNQNTIYISTAQELINLATRVNSGENLEGVTVELLNDIDLNCSEDNPWVPIGKDENNRFEGDFDGKGFSIINMYISNIEKVYNQSNEWYYGYAGLFGYATGTIKNLVIKDSRINVKEKGKQHTYIGIISGTVNKIECCRTENCSIITTVEESEGFYFDIGGVIGSATNVNGVSNTTNITFENKTDPYYHQNYIGGIVGYCSHGTLEDCYNLGNINVPYTAGAVGGIAGDSYGEIKNCFNIGSISTQGEANYNCQRNSVEL